MNIGKGESPTKKIEEKKVRNFEWVTDDRCTLPADSNRFQWFKVIIVFCGQNRFKKLIVVHLSWALIRSPGWYVILYVSFLSVWICYGRSNYFLLLFSPSHSIKSGNRSSQNTLLIQYISPLDYKSFNKQIEVNNKNRTNNLYLCFAIVYMYTYTRVLSVLVVDNWFIIWHKYWAVCWGAFTHSRLSVNESSVDQTVDNK